MYCTVCYCPAGECKDTTGGHRDWWKTVEQMADEQTPDAYLESDYEDWTCLPDSEMS